MKINITINEKKVVLFRKSTMFSLTIKEMLIFPQDTVGKMGYLKKIEDQMFC